MSSVGVVARLIPAVAGAERATCNQVRQHRKGKSYALEQSEWGGGRRGGGGGPWGQGPSGGPHQQPDLEELLKRSQDKLKQVMPGGTRLPGSFVFLVAVVLAAVVAFYAFTFRSTPTSSASSCASASRPPGAAGPAFPPALSDRGGAPAQGDAPEHHRGRHALRRRHARLCRRRARRARGKPDADRRREHRRRRFRRVYWRIKDAQDYLFNIQNPEVTVKEVAESAMREIVGQNNIQPILTEARQKTEQAVQKLMQDVLDTTAPASASTRCSCRRSTRRRR